MGYWMTHTGLEEPDRDPTYDQLPIMLGILPDDGFPEELIATEADAKAVFDDAEAGGGIISQLKAQLLATKLNSLKFPGFADAQFPDGATVGEVIAMADLILDDLANSIPHQSAEIEAVKDLLDAANSNSDTLTLVIGGCLTPTPTPAVLGDVASPQTGGPSTLPLTGEDTVPAGPNRLPIILAAAGILALGGVALLLLSRAGASRRRGDH